MFLHLSLQLAKAEFQALQLVVPYAPSLLLKSIAFLCKLLLDWHPLHPKIIALLKKRLIFWGKVLQTLP
jgi:hypothetical protein